MGRGTDTSGRRQSARTSAARAQRGAHSVRTRAVDTRRRGRSARSSAADFCKGERSADTRNGNADARCDMQAKLNAMPIWLTWGPYDDSFVLEPWRKPGSKLHCFEAAWI